MEYPFEHLTDAQIERYGDRTSGEGPNQSSLEVDQALKLDQAIESHLADCAGCRTRVLDFHRARLGLMSNPVPSAANPSVPGNPGYQNLPTPDCPTEDALRDLAAGLAVGADASRLTQHAAQCPHCGPILRAYAEDFSDELSPEDAVLLLKLKSSTEEWQRALAQKMASFNSFNPKKPDSEGK